MEFEEDRTDDFHQLFEEVKPRILKFPGCTEVQVCTDPDHSNVRYTLSHWDSNDSLNSYRNSAFFKTTWRKTKELFSGKPRAYSLITGE